MISINKRFMSGAVGGIALMCILLMAPISSMAADNSSQPHYKFVMITHAQKGDAFWDYVRKGAMAAAAKYDNVEFQYLNNPNSSKQAQLVINAINQNVDGIAVTLAFPDAMKSAIDRAQKADIPVVGLNSGFRAWKDQGLLMYIGQDEVLAGKAVGKRLNKAGAKSVICVDQQQGAVQLEARCSGIEKTFNGDFEVLYVKGYDMTKARSRMVAKLLQNPDIDYVVTLGAPFAPTAVEAVKKAGSDAKVGTFDLNPRTVSLIQKGKVEFAVDQQPYLQGYEAIDLLYRYKVNGNVLGGGKAVLTGPAFVTKKNVEQVAKAVEKGIRG